ncbi:MAG TPA: RNB domain-containing ribonuclease [Solirubrobacteraceae bacterium]|nr:RNB domain-containing ribonuclease [Solirubrobacteraceae bacterium]
MNAGGRPTRTGQVAVLEKRGRFLVAEPFFERGPRLTLSRDRRADVGDLVLVRGGGGREAPDGRGGGRAQVVRRIGRPDIARDVLEGLMLDRGLPRSFDPAVEREARDAAAAAVDDGAVEGRRDLRSLVTFTIDPPDARDFDDALSAEPVGEDALRVWVHIADVSAYVRPGSLVDREAYRRATSVYVPSAVEPMLPQALSNRACSLVPGEDRLAVTVELMVRGDSVSGASFYRSVIRSDVRLDYDQVDRIFSGIERPGGSWAKPLNYAREAAAALAARRASRGALLVGGEEPQFEFDTAGNVVACRAVPQTESHRLIEHLMIAANEQVARVLDESGAPALYRVHERPDAPAVERLFAQLASLEVPTPPLPRGRITPQQAADLVGEASQLVERHVAARDGRGRRALTRLVLRALKQAYYDPRNLGHAGLQSPRYCHFTSPIRRYPDLICHRSLLSVVGGGEVAPERGGLGAAGTWTSERERQAMFIERDADDVARCFLLQRSLPRLGGRERAFEGEVVGLIGAGAFVQFGTGEKDGLAFEGMLPVRQLRGEWWELNELQTILVGTRSGRAIRLGDSVRVQLGSIDAPRGRVDLLPVEM